MTTSLEVNPGFVLNAESLLRLGDALHDGDGLELRKVDGRLVVVLKKKGKSGEKRESIPLKNRLVLSPRPEPVRTAWMLNHLGEATDNDYSIRRDHRKKIDKGSRENATIKRAIYGTLCMELYGMNLGDGVFVDTKTGAFWLFELGAFTVYVNSSLRPVKWKEGDGEIVYAPEMESEDLRTYKMIDGVVAPI